MYTEQLTQRLLLSPGVKPITLNSGATASATPSAGLDMTKVHRAFVHVQQGANASGAVLTLQLIESVNSDLSSPSNIAGSSSLITTASGDANKQYTFEIRQDQVTKRYLGITITETAGHNALVSALVFGDEASHKPANLNNSADVKTQNVL
jgi:hypothetical protein